MDKIMSLYFLIYACFYPYSICSLTRNHLEVTILFTYSFCTILFTKINFSINLPIHPRFKCLHPGAAHNDFGFWFGVDFEFQFKIEIVVHFFN